MIVSTGYEMRGAKCRMSEWYRSTTAWDERHRKYDTFETTSRLTRHATRNDNMNRLTDQRLNVNVIRMPKPRITLAALTESMIYEVTSIWMRKKRRGIS
jgi:protein subunit release factor A